MQERTQNVQVTGNQLMLDDRPLPGVTAQKSGDQYTLSIEGTDVAKGGTTGGVTTVTCSQQELNRWVPFIYGLLNSPAIHQHGGEAAEGAPPSGFRKQFGEGT